MMKNFQYILVADYVPLANKGEEAIIRGIEDMLRDDRAVEIGLFDDVKEVSRAGNITIFPSEWIFRVKGRVWTGVLSRLRRTLKDVFISLQMRLGYYSTLKNLISSLNQKYRPLQEFFNRAEYVLVGHDGVFCVESCGIIHLAQKAGKCAGILGAGVPLKWYRRLYQDWIFRRTMDEADFCVFRERSSYEYMKRICSDPDKPILAPDPAFAMRAAEPSAARRLLESYQPYRQARKSGRKIVAATVLEKGVVYTFFIPKTNAVAKYQAFAEYIARILDSLVKERNVFVVFLPHSIEENSNDVRAARCVAEAMTSGPDNYVILDEDLDARLLKSIIGECDFLVGERAHSLIGCVSIGTPFLGLTNSSDCRMYEILGEMCQCKDQLVDMNAIDSKAASRKALEIFDGREIIQKSLQETSRVLVEQIEEVSRIVRAAKACKGIYNDK
jgi:polysaccharide pyruvyl transferase WcaK-like protein